MGVFGKIRGWLKTNSESEGSHNNIQESIILSNENANTQQEQQTIMCFNVTGVTFKNDKGKDIQKLLKSIGKELIKEGYFEVYGGYKNKEIIEYSMSVSEFEEIEFSVDSVSLEKDPSNKFDENAIKVMFTMLNGEKCHIGHVPKTHNIEVGELLTDNRIKGIVAKFVGGKIKEVDYDLEKEKDTIVIKELTLGVEIKLYIK